MKDGIPLGNGTSRKIISSSENVPDTWEDFKSLLISEGILIDLSINDSGWYDLGTRLNKANILTDEAAERFGLDENATPDDVFKVIPVSTQSASWGRISGVIEDQEDLSEALDSKLPKSSVVQSTGTSDINLMSQKAVTDSLAGKVNTAEGMGLSHNDYTNADKTKVGILTNSGTGSNFLADDGTYKNVNSAVWGSITGDLEDQEDLNSALSAKVDVSSIVQDSGQSTTDIMSQKAVTEAIASVVTGSGSYRGVVFHAFKQEELWELSQITINNPGSGYTAGSVAIVILQTDKVMNGWVIIKSVGELGEVTEVTLGGVGGWETDQSGSEIETESDGSGIGLTVDIAMIQNHALTLNDIINPKLGDSALVLRDEIDNNLRFHWMYADMNGDGIANWIPAGQAESENIPDDGVYITSEENVRTIADAKKALIDNAEQVTNKVNVISVSSTENSNNSDSTKTSSNSNTQTDSKTNSNSSKTSSNSYSNRF
jgi:hypothetical protein